MPAKQHCETSVTEAERVLATETSVGCLLIERVCVGERLAVLIETTVGCHGSWLTMVRGLRVESNLHEHRQTLAIRDGERVSSRQCRG